MGRKRDPYMRDPNIRSAAHFHLVAGLLLGVAIGAGISSLLDISTAPCVLAGAVIGWLFPALALSYYGGRSTR